MMDALDCLLAYNYKIVEDTGCAGLFRLCGAKAFVNNGEDKKVIAEWLTEIEDSVDYYTNRIVAIGRAML